MESECLNHLLSEQERLAFETDGFFVVENVLNESEIQNLIIATDQVDSEYRTKHQSDPCRPISTTDFIGENEIFLDLLDWPKTLPKVWGLMGWNIQLYHAHMVVTPPVLRDGPREVGRLNWHQDSPRLNGEMATNPFPMVSLKVGFFLTDTREPGRGNFHVIPGSHLLNRIPPDGDGPNPIGATPVCLPAGSVAIFDRRIWHAASPNFWTETRRVLFYGYSYRWLRPRDSMGYADRYRGSCTPIQDQLLFPPDSWGPGTDDLPLRNWMENNLGQEQAVSP